jgi:hypothetical protein
MPGVMGQGPKQAGERGGEESAKFRGNPNGRNGLEQASFPPELDGFIQRHTEHAIDIFEMLYEVEENLSFFLRQPLAPVRLDRRAAG